MQYAWVLIFTQLVSGNAPQPEYIVEEFPMVSEQACLRAAEKAADIVDAQIVKALEEGQDVVAQGYSYTLICEERT